MRFPNPLRPVTARFSAALWAWYGRRRLRRGDSQGALRAFRHALESRPGCFQRLMDLAQGHLAARQLPEARRYLAQAREADPLRYDLQAAALLSRCGYDLDSLCRPQLAARPGPAVRAAAPLRRDVTASQLPYGDCRDVDEYARFRAMPPITRSEIDSTDWDDIIDELLDD